MATLQHLFRAIEYGNAGEVRLLLEKGTPTVAPAGQKQPIHEAAARGFCEIVEILLGQGAKPMILDHTGKNCYQHGRSYPVIIKTLDNQD